MNWLLVVALCLLQLVKCREGLTAEIAGHGNGRLEAAGYSLQSKLMFEQLNARIQNRPGRYLNIELCLQPTINIATELPLVEILRSKGYKFYGDDGSTVCYGYSVTEIVSLKQTREAIELEYFNRRVLESSLFTGRNQQIKELIKLRRADSYVISLTADGHAIVNCSFAHHRSIDVEHLSDKTLLYGKNKTLLSEYRIQHGKVSLVSTTIVPVEVPFNRTLIGRGLHQSLSYSIHVPKSVDIHEECWLSIVDQLTEDFYLDADQFNNIKRYETLDIERPAYMSKQYWYRLTYNLSQLTKSADGYQLAHPVHFRYQQPSSHHEYLQVFIPEARHLTITCGDTTYQLKENYNPNSLSTKIPVGLKQSQRTVVFVTLVMTLCCALFINKTFRKRKFV